MPFICTIPETAMSAQDLYDALGAIITDVDNDTYVLE